MTNNKTQNTKQPLPQPQFINLVMSIASTAVLKLGLDPDNKKQRDLFLARYNIDMLILLKEKTKNNLKAEEEKLLNDCISDLQIQFVNVQNQEKQKKSGQ